jgi:hypothetical protein
MSAKDIKEKLLINKKVHDFFLLENLSIFFWEDRNCIFYLGWFEGIFQMLQFFEILYHLIFRLFVYLTLHTHIPINPLPFSPYITQTYKNSLKLLPTDLINIHNHGKSALIISLWIFLRSHKKNRETVKIDHLLPM